MSADDPRTAEAAIRRLADELSLTTDAKDQVAARGRLAPAGFFAHVCAVG